MEPHTQLHEPVDTDTSSDNLPPPRKLNGLVPPLPTVSFFKRKTITFSYKDESLDLSSLAVDLYIYVTGANPRESDFHEKGGMCFIVAVWRGRISSSVEGLGSNGPYQLKTWARYPVSNPTQFMEAEEIEPTHYISRDPDPEKHRYQYEIQFKKTMAMFSDEGASPYEFTATYEDHFYRHNIQSGYSENNKLVIDIHGWRYSLLDISGLAVHRVDYAVPVEFVAEFSFNMVYPPIFVEVHEVVDLSFPNKINNLVPPPTVSFFKQQSITFNDVVHPRIDLKSVAVDLYIYATGGNPGDPDFETKGGMCYIIAVWRGHFLPRASAEITNVKFKTHGIDIISPIVRWMIPDEVEPKRFTFKDPKTNLYQYDIRFEKTMEMSSYGGHSYEFNARYLDWSQEGFLQTGYIDTEDEQKRIVLEMTGPFTSRTNVFGLTVHRVSRTVPIQFIAECLFESTGSKPQQLLVNAEVDFFFPS